MTAGRPPKSLAQKIQEGTFRADRANFHEPQVDPFEPINPFDQETDLHAYKKWDEILPQLTFNGISNGDRANVEAYCLFYQEAARVKEELERAEALDDEEDGKAGRIRRARQWLVTSWDAVKKFAAQLGLDPINRRKCRAPKMGPIGIVPGTDPIVSLPDRSRDRSLGPDDPEPPKTTGDPLLDSLM